MNIDQLRLFVRITELGSISAAARDLDISASLATRNLAKLEESTGTVLLRRTTRKIALTEAGQLFLNWARSSLGGLDDTLNHLSDLQSKPSGLLRFACPELLAVRYLSSFLGEIAERYPDIRLTLLTVDNIKDIPNDQFDAAIHIGARPASPFISRKVLDIEPLLCASPKYIARHGNPARPEDMEEHRILSHAQYHDLIWTFERRGIRSNHRVKPYIATTNSILLHEMALEGAGIARLTKRVAASDVSEGKLVHVMPDFRCVGGPGEPSAIWIIRPDRYLARRTRLFLDAIITHLRKVGQSKR